MESKKKLRICFVASNPNFDGGMSLLQRNLIDYIKHTKISYEITWVHPGESNIRYFKGGVNYVQLKTPKIIFLEDILFNRNVLKFFNKANFDIINSHAIWGYWLKNYKKRKNQKLIHTNHGVTYNFFKNHFERFSFFSRIFLSPLLLFGYILEKPPIKKADSIICVSGRVKRELEKLYNTKRDMNVIRTGVNLKDFYPRNKGAVRKTLNLEADKTYGLYIGRGGYWRKGLDRAVNISEEIYKKNTNYRLIIVGADYKKVKKIIDNKKSLIYFERVPRETIPLYYSASDFSFCLSRYEGGAPTLVTSETMASGCLLVCSKDSEQEIVEDEKNCLILENFDEKDAERIIKILKNKKKKSEIIKNSIKTIKEFSLEKWGKKYLDILMKETA